MKTLWSWQKPVNYDGMFYARKTLPGEDFYVLCMWIIKKVANISEENFSTIKKKNKKKT